MKSSPRLLDRFLHLIESIPGSDRLIVRIAFFAIIATGIWLILSLNDQYSAVTPTRGGSITEGILGTPRFVNPALALTRADQDVVALVYSGLMRIGVDGTLQNELAESIDISDDGRTYHITVRSDVQFHDGTPLTARDVVYTLQLIQDPDLKSPLRGNWTDVTIEEISEYELTVTLEEPYAPFIENFTVGIMPAHIWSKLPIEQLPFSQLNTEPVGSGPFTVTAAARDTSGLISGYTLEAFRENATADPRLDSVELAFYQNEAALIHALNDQQVDTTAYLPAGELDALATDHELIEQPLPRIFGVFFNQNRSTALRDQAARQALDAALDRNTLIGQALHGHGVPITGPTTFAAAALESDDGNTNFATSTPTTSATTLLSEGGWQQTEQGTWEKEIDGETTTLSVTLRTSNTPLFQSLVDSIAEQWRAVGVEVVTEQYEQTALVQSVIRTREFQALLYGHDMSRSYDLYPFWHSSQQDDPGLNVAQYTNVSVDELLETARTEQSVSKRHEALQAAADIIVEERPAIFLFQPTLTYLVSPDVEVATMNQIGRPADRFSNVAEWHRERDSLWPLFRDGM